MLQLGTDSHPFTYPQDAASDLISEALAKSTQSDLEDREPRQKAAGVLLDDVVALFRSAGFDVNKYEESLGMGRCRLSWVVTDRKTHMPVALTVDGYGKIHAKNVDAESDFKWAKLSLTWDPVKGLWLGDRLLGADDAPLRDLTSQGAPFVRRSALEVVVAYILGTFEAWGRR